MSNIKAYTFEAFKILFPIFVMSILPFFSEKTELNELIIYPIRSEQNSLWLPSDKAKIQIGNNKINVDDLNIEYFIIKNTSPTPIEKPDYIKNISVTTPDFKKIISVESCTKEFNNSCGGSFQSDNQKWLKLVDSYQLEATFLNPNEFICVTVLLKKENMSTPKESSNIVFSGKVRNYKIKQYDDYLSYKKGKSLLPKEFYEYRPVRLLDLLLPMAIWISAYIAILIAVQKRRLFANHPNKIVIISLALLVIAEIYSSTLVAAISKHFIFYLALLTLGILLLLAYMYEEKLEKLLTKKE